MRLSAGRMPPTDGIEKWRFPVTPAIMLHAGDRETLEKQMFEFRLRNNMPVGDETRDVDRFYCDQYPSFCHPEARDINPNAPWSTNESMLKRVSRWSAALVHKTPRGGYPLETSVVAEQRAAICAACPKNVGWRGGCGSCSASTLQLIQQLKQLKKTKHDGTLMGCAVGGWENSSAVWLSANATAISEDQRSAMPAACWRKAIP